MSLRLCTCFALIATSALSAQRAEIVVTGARVYTVDNHRPVVEAFAVKDGKILFAGSEREAMALQRSSGR